MGAYSRAATVLADAEEALSAGATRTPGRVGVVVGDPAWDTCCDDGGQLTVNMRRVYGSDQFPMDAAQTSEGGCCPSYTVADMSLLLLRCAPTQAEGGTLPPMAALDRTAQIVMADAELLYVTVSNTLQGMYKLQGGDEISTFTVFGALIVGPQGGCVAAQIDMLIAWAN